MFMYTVLLHKNEATPGYSVLVPELPGCFSQGDNFEDALTNAKEAIECHLEAMVAEGDDIPIEGGAFILASVTLRESEITEKIAE